MHLYIVNLKRQVEHFTFRLAGNDKMHQFPIQPAHQLRIPLKMSDDEVKSVIAQKEMYGMLAAEAVAKSTFFAGVCYSIDKPVTGVQIDRGFERNDELLMEEAVDARVNATAATAAKIEEQTEGTMRSFQQNVAEVPQPGQEGGAALDHTIRVETPGNPPDGMQQGRRDRRNV